MGWFTKTHDFVDDDLPLPSPSEPKKMNMHRDDDLMQRAKVLAFSIGLSEDYQYPTDYIIVSYAQCVLQFYEVLKKYKILEDGQTSESQKPKPFNMAGPIKFSGPAVDRDALIKEEGSDTGD